MRKQLIAWCIAGVILGVVLISSPLTIMMLRTDQTSEKLAFNSTPLETGESGGSLVLSNVIHVGLIVALGLVLASSIFVIIKRYLIK